VLLPPSRRALHSYRNPCNLPGYGRQDVQCPTRSVPGLFECTWCTGAGDPKLLNRGVGCQMTVPTTKAGCAPVNSKAVQKSSIMQAVSNSRCQCSTSYAMCKSIVDDQRSSFTDRFPTSG
jgi:hypothetical protein